MPPITIKSGGALNFKRAFFFPGKIISLAGGSPFTNEYSVDFDGTDDYVGVTPSSNIDLYGLSMWFSCDTAIDSSTIRGVLFGPDAGILWFFGFGDLTGYLTDEVISINLNPRYGYESSSATIATGWHHVVAAWSTSSATNSGGYGYDIYLDGVKVGNASSETGGAIPSTPYTLASGTEFKIGQRGNTAYAYAGKIDEVAIFDSTISASDVTAIYNNGTPASLTSYSPVSWWRMGDGVEAGSGTTIYDATSYSTRSINFDGSDDYLSIGDITAINSATNISIAGWFNPSSFPHASYNSLWGGGGGYDEHSTRFWLVCNNGSSFQVWFGTSTNFTFAHSISTGTWYHVVLTIDGSTVKLYVNGSQAGSTVSTAPSLTAESGDNFEIGANPTYDPYFWDGLIDEVAVFSSTLSSSDVTAIYNSGVPADLTSLSPVGWWRMGDGTEDGSGTTIYDMSSNSNNGTLTNGPTHFPDSPSANNGTLTNGPTFSTDTP